MPEGPSIVILKEAVQQFTGKTVKSADGTSQKLDLSRISGQKIIDFKSWGKHFLICFKGFSIRIHLMMFGTYRINEHKDKKARLSLLFDDGELNFYACSVQLIEGDINKVYDWKTDVMNKKWSSRQAAATLKEKPEMLVCDALLDQNIFSGVGNIIKNEVLFRIRVHPLSLIGKLPDKKLKDMIKEAVKYSSQFLTWKKEYTLSKHWEAYTKKVCPRDKARLHKANLGKNKRRTFFCTVCQKLYE